MPRFHLTRHFLIASSLVFLLFGASLIQVDRLRSEAVQVLQAEQASALQALRGDLTALATEAAERDLVALYEQGSIHMARVLANALWRRSLGEQLERAQRVDFSACGVANPRVSELAQLKRQACLRTVGQQLAALPAFATLDRAVVAALQDTQIYRLKIFDLRGITVYSTESGQLGEDRSLSPGWVSAARDGLPRSQLSRRDDLNALHRAVAMRDLVNTYLPVFDASGLKVVAVMETYTDVGGFLQQLTGFADSLSHEAGVRQAAMAARLNGQRAVLDAQGTRSTLVLLGLTLAVYLALVAVVRRGQRLLERHADQIQNTRAHLMQTEKMVMLGQMVAGVAHQLNTPLAYCRANLRAFLDVHGRLVSRVLAQRAHEVTVMLPDSGETPEALLEDATIERDMREVRQMIDDALGGIGMMEELVQQLWGFTRLDQAPTDVIDLNAAISSAVYMARAVLPTRIRVEERYSSLPRMVVRVSQLNQALLNLLMNAGQAIDGEGLITVSTAVDGRCVAIEVADNGRGMPAEVQARVFEAFFTTRPEGTGLGLHLVRDIVQAHGGQVALHSQPGQGTRVTLRLPLPGQART
jgi:two-component system NtrC family sensor kinase